MEKTISITLNGVIFNIEEDAYEKLDNYLESIRAHYGGAESEEILTDIESSIAEKFQSKIKGRKKVINEKDVDDVIGVMGTVEEIDEDGESSKTPSRQAGGQASSSSAKNDEAFHFGKRLYRNPDDVVIAGVCSGLSAYFGIDPVFIRILFVLLVFANGVGVLIYIILWIAMPEAKTNAQKLEMRGEPVNVKKLEESIKDKAEIAKKEGKIALDRIKTKQGWLYKILNFPIVVFKTLVQFTKGILRSIWPITRFCFGFIFIVLAIFSILGSTVASGVLIFNINSPYLVSDLPLSVLANSVMYYVAVLAVYFLAVIPFVFLFILGITMLRNKNSFKVLSSSLMLGFWMLAIVAGVIAAGDLVPKVKNSLEETTQAETVNRSYDFDNFEKLYIGANMKASIKKGDDFQISMTGREKDLDRLNFEMEEGQLQITQSPRDQKGKVCVFCFDKEIKTEIIMPELESFVSFQDLEAEIEGFHNIKKFSVGEVSQVSATLDQGEVEVYVAGVGGRLNLEGTPAKIDATLEGNGRLYAQNLDAKEINILQTVFSRSYFSGRADKLIAEVDGPSRLDAKELEVKVVQIKSQNHGKAEVNATETLDAVAQGHGEIYYKGRPETIFRKSQNGLIERLTDYNISGSRYYNEDGELEILFGSDVYSPTMSSIRGIELEPSRKFDDSVEYVWSTNFGSLVDSWENPVYVQSITNKGDKIYWTFLDEEDRNEDEPVYIQLKAKNDNDRIIYESRLKLEEEDRGVFRVVK